MALEQDVIVFKLKEEGINEKLGTGLNFETEGDLNSWVEEFKTAIPEPSKKLEDYTREELEEIAKDQTFKGAKGLQSFVDSVRAKSKKPDGPAPVPTNTDEPEWAKLLRENQDKLMAKSRVDEFEKLVKKLGSDLSDIHLNRVKKGIQSDATEAEIKTEIEAYKKELADLNIKDFGTPGGGGGKNNSSIKSASEEWVKKQNLKTKK